MPRGKKRVAGLELPIGISFRNVSTASSIEYASGRGCDERRMLCGLPRQNNRGSHILSAACLPSEIAQLELMLALARTNNQVPGRAGDTVVTTAIDDAVASARLRPAAHDSFLCRELLRRICNWVMQACVDVANDVSDLVLREWHVDAA